jgi:hypothetical protein
MYLQLPAVMVNFLFLDIHSEEGLVQGYVTEQGR